MALHDYVASYIRHHRDFLTLLQSARARSCTLSFCSCRWVCASPLQDKFFFDAPSGQCRHLSSYFAGMSAYLKEPLQTRVIKRYFNEQSQHFYARHFFDRRAHLRQDLPWYPILFDLSPKMFGVGAIICGRGNVIGVSAVASRASFEWHGEVQAVARFRKGQIYTVG